MRGLTRDAMFTHCSWVLTRLTMAARRSDFISALTMTVCAALRTGAVSGSAINTGARASRTPGRHG